MDRDLASPELWERSLERSRRRRAHSKNRVTNVQVSAALIAASVAVPTQPAAAQELERGNTGDDVRAVQRALGVSADGEFGPVTRRAVRDFQARNGLVADGIVGPNTRRALGLGGTSSPASPRGTGSSNAQTVMSIQRALGIGADGVYGPITRQSVRDFQRNRGLVVDGIAGPATLGALGVSGTTQGAGGGSGTAPSTTNGSAVGAAQSKLGAAYELGGEGPAWDCSGLTQWAMARAGVTIPRTSFDQFNVGTPVARESIQAGDLVFFDANGPGASHVGIAISNSTVISATTHGVREHAIGGDYWGTHYYGARRF